MNGISYKTMEETGNERGGSAIIKVGNDMESKVIMESYDPEI